jgi:hypothetical protein
MRERTTRNGMKCEEALGMSMQGDPADFIATWDFQIALCHVHPGFRLSAGITAIDKMGGSSDVSSLGTRGEIGALCREPFAERV